ncbi:hypothetical protein GOODEAATRI_033600 [Goodea atripinnis]|uniref:Uncharacterized protein n=1 Tax=Goodea atripinnis TaxID=208336 RepID=A0ABV0N6J3_9TELE
MFCFKLCYRYVSHQPIIQWRRQKSGLEFLVQYSFVVLARQQRVEHQLRMENIELQELQEHHFYIVGGSFTTGLALDPDFRQKKHIFQKIWGQAEFRTSSAASPLSTVEMEDVF